MAEFGPKSPLVSIVLPTLDERRYIRDCLDSLLAQDYPGVEEILVVDGGSLDGTREIASVWGGLVRVVDNPCVTAAAAMNIGIEAAMNELVVRADAHTLYAHDYVSSCVASLLRTDAAIVGGPMRPVGKSPFGRAVAAVTSSPFGIGPGRFHYSDKVEDVDTVYLGAFNRQTVIDAGGYDEVNLQWAAEDQELNFRVRRARRSDRPRSGDPFAVLPTADASALVRQYHNYGMCKASTFAKHRTLPYWRPLVPGAMVAFCVTWCVPGGSPPAVVGDIADRGVHHWSSRRGRPPEQTTRCHAAPGGLGAWRSVIGHTAPASGVAADVRMLSGRPFDIDRKQRGERSDFFEAETAIGSPHAAFKPPPSS